MANHRRAPRKEQFSGCLIGQCLGDALGCPVEGCTPRTAASYIRTFLNSTLAGRFGRPGRPFGQYTDDSQLARELMQSYGACRGFDPADYALRIAAIFTSGRIVGPGAATSDAAFRLAKGVPWEEAETPDRQDHSVFTYKREASEGAERRRRMKRFGSG